MSLLKNTDSNIETLNIIDDHGMTPFLAYINHFSENFQNLKTLLIQLCNFKAIEFKDDFEKYDLRNSSLFDKVLE